MKSPLSPVPSPLSRAVQAFELVRLLLLLAFPFSAEAQDRVPLTAASQAEVNAGTSTTKGVTPATLSGFSSAVKGGANDDTLPLQALLNQGGNIKFPPGKFTTGALYLTNNTTITGPGAVVTLKAGVTNVGVFNVVSSVTNVIIKNLTLNGLDFSDVSSWSSRDSLSNRMGLNLYINSKGSRFENVTCLGFNKAIAIFGDQDGLNVFRKGDLVIEGCECYSNFFGLYAASSTSDANHAVEYFTATLMRLHNNTVNFFVGGGNIGVVGNELLEGYIGVLVDGTAQNAAHSYIAGNHINHNSGYGILIQNLSGQTEQIYGNEILSTGTGNSITISNSSGVTVFGNQFGLASDVVIGAGGVPGSSKGPNFIHDNFYAGLWGGTGLKVFDWNNFSNLVTDNTTNAQHWGNYSFDTSTNADPYISNPYNFGAMVLMPTNLPPAVPFTPNASFAWNSNGVHIYIVRSTGLAWSSTNVWN